MLCWVTVGASVRRSRITAEPTKERFAQRRLTETTPSGRSGEPLKTGNQVWPEATTLRQLTSSESSRFSQTTRLLGVISFSAVIWSSPRAPCTMRCSAACSTPEAMPWSTIMRSSSSDIVSSGARLRPNRPSTRSARPLRAPTKGEANEAKRAMGRASMTANASGFVRPIRLGMISAQMMVSEPMKNETRARETGSAFSTHHATGTFCR